MSIDLKTIKHISKLSRISVDEKRAEKLAGDLNSIFDFIEKLDELKTDNVEPLTSVAETPLKLRSDEVKSKNIREQIIKNSHDMIYYISMLSTTGGKLKVSPRKILINYNKIKKIDPKKNCVIGFGITEKTISKFKNTDGLVVGSQICKEITRSLNNRQNPVINVSKMVSKLRKKIS